MKLYINISEIKKTIITNISEVIGDIKQLYYLILDLYTDFIKYINTGSANCIMMSIIFMGGIIFLSSTLSTYNIEIAESKTAYEQIKLLRYKEKTTRLVEIEKVKAGAGKMVMEYQLRIEETRAAANPYIIPTQQTTPINVFIDTLTPKYTVKTSDGETEIEISTIKVKGVRYSPEQRKLMAMAFHIGKEVGFPETIQALLLQETRAGAYGDRIGDINLPIGKRSYGVLQMKVATARKVLKKHKSLIPTYFPTRKTYKRLRDEEIIIRLIQDDEFNIRLAALNFRMHRLQSRNWAQAVVAYNTGQGKANTIDEPKKHIYYNHILKRLINDVRPFNKKTNLTM